MVKGIMQGAGAVAKSPIGFVRGLSYALRGGRFVYFQHPRLARYWVFPILITGAALVATFYGAGTLYDDLGGAVWSLFPESWSEAVEHILTGGSPPPFSFKRMLADIVRTIRLEVGKVLLYAVIVGPMFLASFFLPGIGQIISVVGFAFTAVYLGVDYVDWPAARRDWSVGDRVAFTRRQLPAMAGFGTGVWVLLFIPLVNLFFMPAAVAGGTMLFVAMQDRVAG